MSHILRKTGSLLIVLSFLLNYVNAQDVIRQAPCFDSSLKSQADSLKENLTLQGFKVIREATMTIENEYEMPVIVPLTAGSWYHIAFIGDARAHLYEVRMYDYTEKQVVYKKQGIENNVISYSFIPQSTEYHIIKPVQVGKRKIKNFCGYILFFRKEQ
ncbi:MAG: hypothetical protein ABIN48_03370 [Ginsengibacter sp.]